MYVFFCQMPKTKARSGAFQKGAYVRSNRRQGHIARRPRARGREALHHFETAHYCEFIGHYKKRHTHAPHTGWQNTPQCMNHFPKGAKIVHKRLSRV